LRLQLDWDDRTQTSVVWHYDPGVSVEEVAIRCDFIIRADPSEAFSIWKRLEGARPTAAKAPRTDADAPLALAALVRRVDAYLPPTPVSLWFDRDGQSIEDPSLLETFERSLSSGRNLTQWTEQVWIEATRRTGALSLADLLATIAGKAKLLAVDSAGAHLSYNDAAVRADHDWQEVDRLLELRAHMSSEPDTSERDLTAEREMSRLLLAALKEPVAEWSGASLLVVSASQPTVS
jgi:hypothetical protein